MNSEHERKRGKKYYYKKKKRKIKPPLKNKNDFFDSQSSQQNISNHQKSSLSEQQQKILAIGKRAYNKALEYYFFPSLPVPKLIFDYNRNTGFNINFQNYQITLNLANTPDIFLETELKDYFYSLSIHEIGHYVYCPYDNTTNLKLLSGVIKAGINKFYAPIILNIFADLLIDYRNHQEFPDLMEWELQITVNHILENNKENLTDLWKILVRSYEIMWNIQILPKKIDTSKIELYAKIISKIILENYEDESLWLNKVKRIANVIKDILKQSCRINEQKYQGIAVGGNNENILGINPIDLPEDVKNTFGDLAQIKYPDFIKNRNQEKNPSQGPEQKRNLKENLEELAPILDFDEFRELLLLNGFHDSIDNLAIWYRGLSQDLIKIEIYQKRPGGSLPFRPEIWRLGDPIEELDPIQTLLTSPIIIPNITTRKWVHREGPGHITTDTIPDLLTVIDSSGSMDWNFTERTIEGRYHTALIASFAAIQYAIKKGAYIAGINFSDRIRTARWTNNLTEVEKTLLNYQGYGTVLPINRIMQLAELAEHPILILLISDLEIENWESVLPKFQKLLKMNHKLIAFFIDGDNQMFHQSDFQDLIQLGAKFFAIQDMNDLIGLVVKEISHQYR